MLTISLYSNFLPLPFAPPPPPPLCVLCLVRCPPVTAVQRRWKFRSNAGNQSNIELYRARWMASASYLQKLVRNRRRVLSVRRADVRHEVRQLDIWWFPGMCFCVGMCKWNQIRFMTCAAPAAAAAALPHYPRTIRRKCLPNANASCNDGDKRKSHRKTFRADFLVNTISCGSTSFNFTCACAHLCMIV